MQISVQNHKTMKAYMIIGKRLRAGIKRTLSFGFRVLGTVFGDFITDGDHIGVDSLAGVVFTGVIGRIRFGVFRSRRIPGVLSFIAVLLTAGFFDLAEFSNFACRPLC